MGSHFEAEGGRPLWADPAGHKAHPQRVCWGRSWPALTLRRGSRSGPACSSRVARALQAASCTCLLPSSTLPSSPCGDESPVSQEPPLRAALGSRDARTVPHRARATVLVRNWTAGDPAGYPPCPTTRRSHFADTAALCICCSGEVWG